MNELMSADFLGFWPIMEIGTGSIVPPILDHIITEDGINIITQKDSYIITE